MQKTIDKITITLGNKDDETASVTITTEPPFESGVDEAEETPNVVLATAIIEFLQGGDYEEEVLH